VPPADHRYAALQQPALASHKASGSAFLALARAGNRLIAVGERGIVMLSDDLGGSWRQASVPVSVSLTAVQFIDERQGWAVGHLGVVLHSSDGGATWTRQLDGLRAAQLVLSAEEAAGADANRLSVARALIEDGPDKPFFDLHFESPNSGVVVGAYNLAFRTDDGGRSWKPCMEQVDNPKGLHLYSLRTAGSKTYIAGEQGLLLRAAGDRERFQRVETPFKGTYFGVVAARDGEVVAFGLRGKAFWSPNGVDRWQECETSSSNSLSAGLQLNDGRIVLASQTGDLLVSEDGGRRYSRLPGREPSPITGLLQAGTSELMATSLRGVRRISLIRTA
jgi:photosystem II stability/assembly factor-like uncharacterized protein